MRNTTAKNTKIDINIKYFIINCFLGANILDNEDFKWYKLITDYTNIAELMDMRYSNPKRLRQEIRKLLNASQETGYISYKILPQNQDIEIYVHITEPKAKDPNYTCIPYNLMSLNISKDLKMYFIALFRYSFHKGYSNASNEQIALTSGMSIRKVQMLHKEAIKIGLIGDYEASKGGYKYLGDGKKIGNTSKIPLFDEENNRYYYQNLLPKKTLIIKKAQ